MNDNNKPGEVYIQTSAFDVNELVPDIRINENNFNISVNSKSIDFDFLAATVTTIDKSKMDDGWVDSGRTLTLEDVLKILRDKG